MKTLFEYLKNLENRTAFVGVLMLILTFVIGIDTLLPTGWVPWIDFSALVVVIGFKIAAPTGVLTKGQSVTFWILNVIAFALSVIKLADESMLFDFVDDKVFSNAVTLLIAIQGAVQGMNNNSLKTAMSMLPKHERETAAHENVSKNLVVPASIMRKISS